MHCMPVQNRKPPLITDVNASEQQGPPGFDIWQPMGYVAPVSLLGTFCCLQGIRPLPHKHNRTEETAELK